jgi:uncharacterized DUF497 family protein
MKVNVRWPNCRSSATKCAPVLPFCAWRILEGDTMPPAFGWDENKARPSLRKHRVTFLEAVSVFEDPVHSAEEIREIIIGHSRAGRLLLVCFTEPLEDEVRILSARRVTKREKKDYEEYVADQD